MLSSLKYSKIIKIVGCLFIMVMAIFLLGNFALALDTWGGDTNGTNFQAATGLGGGDLRVIIARIIRTFIGFLGILAVCLIIYGGFVWMTSGGDENKIEQAKNILKNSVVGLIIIILAFAIATFILNLLGGASGNGGNGPGSGPGPSYGLSALGNGIIQSHYPARDQKEVPRNTSIIISFREAMLGNTLCQTADTIEAKCNSELTNRSVIRIFKKSQWLECVNKYKDTPAGCTSLVDAKVYSTDNKTFVFVPVNYLGSPSGYIDYTVYLSNGLLRQSGERAFPGAGGDYGWSFEVSNKIDLTPPKVNNNGVFPTPDNLRDTKDPNASIDAKQAVGTITVNSKPTVNSDASASVVKTPNDAVWSDADVTVDKSCDRSGAFTVNVDSNNKDIIRLKDVNNILLGQGTISGKTVSFALCNLKLTLDSGDFAVNSLWTVTIRSMVAADIIIVGDTVYTASNAEDIPKHNFEAISADTRDIAESIRNVLVNNSEITPSRGATRSIVNITAEIAGVAGNSINLSSSNDNRLKVVAMDGGKDKEDKVTVNGRKDQPMNSALQINFNEAIMPLTVSGTSSEVYNYIRVVNAKVSPVAEGGTCTADTDCKSFKCQKEGRDCKQNEADCVCVGDNNYLQGKFAISNQYQTVEFLSDKECGFNACGEKIYCLPANSNLKVELNAANLISCAKTEGPDAGTPDNSLCQTYSPFNICDGTRKLCRDNAGNYYPQAAKTYSSIVNGIVDAAFNSLDGNRNGTSTGPVSYYNENDKNTGNGDSYKWSFFISDKLDLNPPKITATVPILNPNPVDLTSSVKISFDKLMLSSRLTTGSLMIKNGQENIQHYLLNLRSYLDQPLGYWVTNTVQQKSESGEFIDYTDVSINHSAFSKSSTYKAQAGSGLKDIYQNCFLPCASDSAPCSGVDNQKPCCCDGTPATSCP